ncbi:Agc/pka protein kinase, partial [Globisporangium splendens]
MAVVMREKRAANKRRRDIFAESVSFEEPLEIVKIPKSDESKAIILQALQSNFLFSTIDKSDIELIVQLMFEKTTQVDDVVIKEGDSGDFFYVVESGVFNITVSSSTANDGVVGVAQRGAAFGELALVYNCPRQATIACAKAGRLWALDRVTFRRLVARNQMDQIDECKSALQKVELLKPLTDAQLGQLAEAAQIVTFKKGERIIKKGERGKVLYIIKKGTVDCTDMVDTVRDRESLRLSDNDYFGERALMTHEPRATNVTAATDVIREGDKGTTSYIIQSGTAVVKQKNPSADKVATLSTGDFFGEMSLLRDEPRVADIIAQGLLQCLSLNQAKFIELLGPLQAILNREADERKSALTKRGTNVNNLGIPMSDLEILHTLGSGTFGRVKLVRHKTTGTPYAMKVLSKATIVAYEQQQNVMNKKSIIGMCNHLFTLKSHQTYKDSKNLYLLIEFVQGGELFTYLHCSPNSPGKLSNDHTRFLASHVPMAIEYLHNRNIVYRDLKPENLLIDPMGYLKVVDFGFAKIVEDRTYTLCGTPEYLAPELVLGKGHNKGVDCWALGILIYELVVCHSPFAGSNQSDQMQICRNIVKEPVMFPPWVSEPCRDIISKLLEHDLTKRLGLTHGGANVTRAHPWFSGHNWDKVYNKTEPAPYKPRLASALDTSKFDFVADSNDESAPYSDDGSDWDKDF